eukprot:m.423432 g.423432  ORF g.423432 m.423432 type:complete len:1049 (-) comp20211_c3_seq1:334-3480(-)
MQVAWGGIWLVVGTIALLGLPHSSNAQQLSDAVVVRGTLDLRRAILEIEFSKDVLDAFPSQAVIRDAQSRGGNVPIIGTYHVVRSLLFVFLTQESASALKLAAASYGDLVLVAPRGWVFDTNMAALPAAKGLVLDQVADDVSPQLRQAVLVDTQESPRPMLQLDFSEIVDTDAFDVSGVALVASVPSAAAPEAASPAPHERLELSAATTVQRSASSAGMVLLTLTEGDVGQLRSSDVLCKSLDHCSVHLRAGTVSDLRGNVNLAATTTVSSLDVDLTAPRIVEFHVDLEGGLLRFVLSEPVSVASFDPTAVAIGSVQSGHTYRLTGGLVVAEARNQVAVMLTQADASGVKATVLDKPLTESLFLLARAGTVEDSWGNPSVAVKMPELPPTRVVADKTPPKLEALHVDMTARQLLLQFDEPVEPATADTRQMGLRSSVSFCNPSSGYRDAVGVSSCEVTAQVLLEDAKVSAGPTPSTLVVQLTAANMATVATSGQVLSSAETSFVTMGAEFVRDLAGNWNAPIAPTHALQATSYLGDSKSPTIAHAAITMADNAVVVSLKFSETVALDSINPSKLELRIKGKSWVPLDGVQVNREPSDLFVFNLVLPTSLFSMISRQLESKGSSFQASPVFVLRAAAGAASDRAGNEMAKATVPIEDVSFDSDPPELQRIELDLNKNLLHLIFSEEVVAMNIVTNLLTIQSAQFSPRAYHRLVDSLEIETQETIGPIVVIQLGFQDISSLKASPWLGTYTRDTYIKLEDGFITDQVGNPSVRTPLPMRASTVIPDRTPPTVTSFRLDMGDRHLAVIFDEPIQPEFFNPLGLTLQSGPDVAAENTRALTLSGMHLLTVTNQQTLVSFTLLQRDYDRLRHALFPLASWPNATFLSVKAGAAADIAGNPLVSVPNSSAIVVDDYQFEYQLDGASDSGMPSWVVTLGVVLAIASAFLVFGLLWFKLKQRKKQDAHLSSRPGSLHSKYGGPSGGGAVPPRRRSIQTDTGDAKGSPPTDTLLWDSDIAYQAVRRTGHADTSTERNPGPSDKLLEDPEYGSVYSTA